MRVSVGFQKRCCNGYKMGSSLHYGAVLFWGPKITHILAKASKCSLNSKLSRRVYAETLLLNFPVKMLALQRTPSLIAVSCTAGCQDLPVGMPL